MLSAMSKLYQKTMICFENGFSKPSIYVFSYFPFGFEGRMWDLIVSVPDHCLSFYFVLVRYHFLSVVCELLTEGRYQVVNCIRDFKENGF